MADLDLLPAFSFKQLAAARERRPRPPAHATALDVDGRTLRVVQTSTRGGKPVASRILTAPLNLPADADRTDAALFGRALAAALEQLRCKPGPVVMGIPRAQVVLKTLLLPVITDVRELASVVHLQIGRDLPFRLADAAVDFKVHRQVSPPAPKPAPNAKPPGEPVPAPPPKLEVVVAVAKRDVVEFYERAAVAAGLKLAGLGLLPYASARCVEAIGVADEAEACTLVSLRAEEVGIEVIAGSAILFSRGAALRLASEPEAPPDAGAFANAAVIEVVRSLHSFAGQGALAEPKKVFITGATGHEAAVVAALGSRVSSPVALLDLSALALSVENQDQAAGATAAIGLALGYADEPGLPFDFLNPKRPAVQRDLRRVRIWTGLAVAAALFLVVFGVRTWLVSQRQKTLDIVNAEVAAAEKNRPTYKRMIQQAAVANEWVRGERDWLLHYAYLTAVLPPSEELYITSFSVSGQGALRLAVRAKSGQILAKLEKQLRAAGYDVKPVAITPSSDRNGYEFLSTVELIVPDKLKIDLAKVKPPARPADDASLEPPRKKGGG